MSGRLCANGYTRAENVHDARQLRADGMTIVEIAEVLGVKRTAASSYLSDPDGKKQRARQDRYGALCVDCGKRTNGSNGRIKQAKRCKPCAVAHQQTEEARLAATFWTRERILASMHWWHEVYGEPPAMADWNPTQARIFKDREREERGTRLIEQGRIPWFTAVIKHFGTWNAGIRAAGYEPRGNTGGGGNQLRRRRRLRTHCSHGHEFTPENTYVSPVGNYRYCRECAREAHRRYRQRKRERIAA